MNEILENLEKDLHDVVIDHEESQSVPIMQAQIMIEGVKVLTSIAESLVKLSHPMMKVGSGEIIPEVCLICCHLEPGNLNSSSECNGVVCGLGVRPLSDGTCGMKDNDNNKKDGE